MDRLLGSLDANQSVLYATVAYADDLAVLVEGISRMELEQRAADIMASLVEW